MSDLRRTPVNDRVAAAHLAGEFPGRDAVTGTAAQVAVTVTDLRRTPDGARDRQLILGEGVTCYEVRDGWCFVQADKDGYVGYVTADTLVPDGGPASHWVSAPATHAYAAPDMKSPDRLALSHGSLLRVTGETGGFAETPAGFVPLVHLSDSATRAGDPVAVAELFLGTPYLWGGNSRWGIDCSGLVQAAHLACGIPCPGDSDQQQAELGQTLPPGSDHRRGDLLFWRGHVALVMDPGHIIHANAWRMATAVEPLHAALARIEAQGDGRVRAHKRL